MLGSITINYFLGRWISKKQSKKALAIGVTINLLILIINKYTNFAVENLNVLFSLLGIPEIQGVDIKLPVGISFYTFQSISYLVDVYRKDTKVQKNFVDLALYVSLFPQLVAGPIVRYKDIAEQLSFPKLNFELFSYGVERFVIGLIKKVLIANVLANTVDTIFAMDYSLLDASAAWWGILLYSLQIYFDFSGYSDMAIGIGYMLGFKFLENFNFPYIAKSIREFWTRWHISLSNWFRDYLYIPLGGNRGGEQKTYRNLFIVFLLTGLWHGASWNFVVWGLIHGIFIVIERVGFNKYLEKLKFVNHLYLLFVVVIAWVFFRVETLSDGMFYLSSMFGLSQSIAETNAMMFLNTELILVFLIALIMSFDGFRKSYDWIQSQFQGTVGVTYILEFFKFLILLVLLFYCFMNIAAGSYNPFIYFRF